MNRNEYLFDEPQWLDNGYGLDVNSQDSTQSVLGQRGTLEEAELAEYLQKWNWGAFFFGPLWCLWHRRWGHAAVFFVPLIGFLTYFVCLVQGNRLAWESRDWSSFGAFRKSQKNWAFAGIAWCVIGTMAALPVIHFGQARPRIEQISTLVEANVDVVDELGDDIAPVDGFFNYGFESGYFKFPIEGPFGEADVYAMQKKYNGKPILWEVLVRPAGEDEAIVVVDQGLAVNTVE